MLQTKKTWINFQWSIPANISWRCFKIQAFKGTEDGPHSNCVCIPENAAWWQKVILVILIFCVFLTIIGCKPIYPATGVRENYKKTFEKEMTRNSYLTDQIDIVSKYDNDDQWINDFPSASESPFSNASGYSHSLNKLYIEDYQTGST